MQIPMPIKYDEQKVSDLGNINSQIQNYQQVKGSLPTTMAELSSVQYSSIPKDTQSGKMYEYILVNQSTLEYQLCAEFNKASDGTTNGARRIMPYEGVKSHGNTLQANIATRSRFLSI